MLWQACKLTFSSYRLQPMGSYPRLVDKKGSHELFGPVNKLYCSSYDRAMVLYLACLKVSLSPLLPPLTTNGKAALRKHEFKILENCVL